MINTHYLLINKEGWQSGLLHCSWTAKCANTVPRVRIPPLPREELWQTWCMRWTENPVNVVRIHEATLKQLSALKWLGSSMVKHGLCNAKFSVRFWVEPHRKILWCVSSVGWNTCLSRMGPRVRVPYTPPVKNNWRTMSSETIQNIQGFVNRMITDIARKTGTHNDEVVDTIKSMFR